MKFMVANCGAVMYNKKDSNKERGVLPLEKALMLGKIEGKRKRE